MVLPVVALFAAVVVLTVVAAGGVTLDDARRLAAAAATWAEDRFALVFVALVAVQALGMALSLPLKAVLTVLAGALVGGVGGSAATMLGVLLGTSALFVAVRRGLRGRFQAAMGERARRLERRLAQRPVRAVIGLRLIVTLPYGPITIASALTSVRYRDFLLGSLLGDLPVVVLYAFAGRELAGLRSLSDVLSPMTLAVLLTVAALVLATAFLGGRGDPLVDSADAAGDPDP